MHFFYVNKNVGSKQFWNLLGPKRMLGPKHIKVKDNWDPKNLGPDECHQNKQKFRSQKSLDPKNFRSKKIFGP